MTDHYAEARRRLRGLNEYQEAEGLNDFTILSVALEAQVHATLALAEQQRIANVIALWQDEDASGTSQEASSALVKRESVSEGYGLKLRPEIARALRIETP